MYYCSASMLISSLFLLFAQCLGETIYFNVSLNPQDLLANNHMNVLHYDGQVKVYCGPGQQYYQVVHLPNEEDYETCPENVNGNTIIGSCENSPLVIYIRDFPVKHIGIISFEIGKTYRFGAYNSVTDNSPCLDGIKFSFTVVESLEAATAMTAVSSYIPSPSPSISMATSSVGVTSSIVSSEVSQPMITTTSSSSLSTTATPTHTRPVAPTPSSRPTVSTATEENPTNDRNDPIVHGISDHGVCVKATGLTVLLTVLLVFLTLLL